MKRFNKNYFQQKYKEKGGLKKLTEMLDQKVSYARIGEHFGVTKQRISIISKAIKNNHYTNKIFSDCTINGQNTEVIKRINDFIKKTNNSIFK